MSIVCEGISHLLLDIEGTTCPVSFVAETLFPYASEHLAEYLQLHREDAVVRDLVAEVIRHWQADEDPEAVALLSRAISEGSLPMGLSDANALSEASGAPGSPLGEAQEAQQDHNLDGPNEVLPSSVEPTDDIAGDTAMAAVVPYLRWLIRKDRKLTPLKELQGAIWEEGYARGLLRGPLFDDVPPALRRWNEQGLVLAVYSSGSVRAQQLLYGHSEAGDLRGLFRHWFDTRTGLKQEAASYRRISEAMGVRTERVLFISDVLAELDAAAQAGMQVVCSIRPGNPQMDPGSHASISSVSELCIR